MTAMSRGGAPQLEVLTPSSFHRRVSLSFDDAPRELGALYTRSERAHLLIKALGNRPAVFFANSPSRAQDGLEILRIYALAGHRIANHTAQHLNLNKTDTAVFLRDVARADQELRDLPQFRRWFRFPYLREGRNAEQVRAAREGLAQLGYQQGYVTVDTQDWFADVLLAEEGRRGYIAEHLCRVYSDMLIEDLEFFDAMSVGALGRSVAHTMLLHETDLNALCLTEIIRRIEATDWRIVSPDESYEDPIALQEPPPHVRLNQGRVFALAEAAGYKGPYWRRFVEVGAIREEFERRGVWKTGRP